MNFYKGTSLGEIQRSFNQETKKETKTKNDASTTNRSINSQLRDKGTVQSSIWRLHRLKPSEKWFVVVTRNDRDWGASMCLEQEPYALVVTVTDKDNLRANLYSEIRQRIQEKELVRGQERAKTQ